MVAILTTEISMRMRVCYPDYHETGMCWYLLILIEKLLHSLQLFYFNLRPTSWISRVQDLHIDVALFSEIHLELHESSCISNYYFAEMTAFREEKVGLPSQLWEAFPITLKICLPLFQ
jgi:hypothetical protein